MRLIDAEKLKNMIEGTDWHHISLQGNLVCGARSDTHTPLYKADDIYKALEEAPTVDAADVLRKKWIPCSERLPDKYVDASGDLINFMAYMPEYGVDIANYSSQAKTWFFLGVPAIVTHWMPLPEPPEEVKNDE